MDTQIGIPIDKKALYNYLSSLINHFFKILPIREDNEESLVVYMKSLQKEIVGCKEFILAINNDASFITLVSILQYLIDNPDCSVKDVRREVFKAISVCNKLKTQYAEPQNSCEVIK